MVSRAATENKQPTGFQQLHHFGYRFLPVLVVFSRISRDHHIECAIIELQLMDHANNIDIPTGYKVNTELDGGMYSIDYELTE